MCSELEHKAEQESLHNFSAFVISLPILFLGLPKHIIQHATLCKEAKATH